MKVNAVIAAADATAIEMGRRETAEIPVVAGNAENPPIMQFLASDIKTRTDGKLILVNPALVRLSRVIGTLLSIGIGAGGTLIVQKIRR
jgi:hypothetical protein